MKTLALLVILLSIIPWWIAAQDSQERTEHRGLSPWNAPGRGEAYVAKISAPSTRCWIRNLFA